MVYAACKGFVHAESWAPYLVHPLSPLPSCVSYAMPNPFLSMHESVPAFLPARENSIRPYPAHLYSQASLPPHRVRQILHSTWPANRSAGLSASARAACDSKRTQYPGYNWADRLHTAGIANSLVPRRCEPRSEIFPNKRRASKEAHSRKLG
jgi:hypothetical protein